MKLSPRLFLCVLGFALALTPAVRGVNVGYMPASRALARLESIVTLTSAQKSQALQIFQKLKDTMDAIPPDERPQKGAASRQEAIAAIRAILTPEQQAIYDRTPQGQGGGSMTGNPAMKALNAQIHAFIDDIARTAPEITNQVGVVEKVTQTTSSTATHDTVVTRDNDPGQSHGSTARPDSGNNTVQVTGSSGTKVFVIYWKMNQAGEMSLVTIENKDG